MKSVGHICILLLVALFLVGVACSDTRGQDKLKGKTVNINKASAEELVKNVPMVTPELAKNMVKYRKDNGDYQTIEELLQVPGMNRDLLRKIKPFLILEGIGGKDCTC